MEQIAALPGKWRSGTRAARDYLADEPAIATEVALATLHWISEGHGYDLAGQDVHDPDQYAQGGARVLGQEERLALQLRPISRVKARREGGCAGCCD